MPYQELEETISRIRDWQNWLDVERGYSSGTIKQYIWDLRLFVRWVKRPPETVNAMHIRGFLGYLKNERKYKSCSLARKLSSLRGFYKFLRRCTAIETNPCDEIDSPKREDRMPIYLTSEEVKKIFEILEKDLERLVSLRDYAIFKLLYHTGMRISELVNLTATDIWETGLAQERTEDGATKEGFCVRIIGKGNKERIVPLSKVAKNALDLWITHRPETPGHSILFINLKTKRKVTPRAIEKKIKTLAKRAKIEKTVTPHKLRHTFATELLNKGVNLVDIQALLGHASLATTQIYTHTDVGKLSKAVELLE